MDVDTQEERTLEEKLEYLSEYDNNTQLYLLIHEIEHLMDHAIQPPITWFEQRIDYVILYSGLNWRDFVAQSYDEHLSRMCRTIIQSGQQIMEDWSVSPMFDMSDYYTLLHTVNEARAYFTETYSTTQDNVGDLLEVIAGMDRL
jgi:hypothetical protein